MTVYTYAVIDMDLLRDDVSSASGILPALFWTDRAKAAAALAAELRERWIDTQDTNEDMPEPVFTENQHDEGGLTVTNIDWLGNEAEAYVYALKPAN